MKGRLFFVFICSISALAHPLSALSMRARLGSLLRLRGGAEQPIADEERWDYIILGGGAAGCVLANRLTADPSLRVLLLEAGIDGHQDLRVRIPASLIKVLRSNLDWNYETEPGGKVEHPVYLCRGKTLGGSTCTNVMLYQRGTPADYKSWELAGASGWGPSDVLPYYRRAECNSGGESKYHGVDGPITVGEVPYANPLSDIFFKAMGEQGYRQSHDFNDWSTPQEGFGKFKVTQAHGERVSTAGTYLELAKKRANLCVRTSAQVTKLLLKQTADGARAAGVVYSLDGKLRAASIASGGEVLLCAGAIQSPQLLMLSGVGPREHLEELGIPVVKELEGVGEGLQDHPAVLVSYSATKPLSLTNEIRLGGTSLPNPVSLFNWFVRGKGVLTTVACEQGGFLHTRADRTQPDLQLRFLPEAAMSPDGMNTLEKVASGKAARPGFTFQLLACRPQSRGRVRLRDANPLSKPIVEGLYLSAPDTADLATLREGVKLARKICKARAFDDVRGEEIFPGSAIRSDEEIEQYVRSSIHSANALTSSCRMGSASDPLAVLDSELKVRGVESLRVVDASAMPQIIGGQTGAPTIMLAEKAADLILHQRERKRSVADRHMLAEANPAQAVTP